MIEVDLHAEIPRAVEDVFERLVDIDGYSAWRAGAGGIFLACRSESPGPVREGTRYVDHTRLGTATGEVAELEPPFRVVFHYTARWFGKAVMEGWPGYTLEPDGTGGTRVHHHAEARLYGPLRFLEPLMQRLAEYERRCTLEALEKSFR